MTEEQQKVVDFLKSKTGKSKFYFNDFLDVFPDKGPREVKKVLTSMVNGEILEFWSLDSTSMYWLMVARKQSHADAEE